MHLETLPVHQPFGCRPWESALVWFLDTCGTFAIAALCAPPLVGLDRLRFRRLLELEGQDLHSMELDLEGTSDLERWLAAQLPSCWGRGRDLRRIAFVLDLGPEAVKSLSPEGAAWERLAARFPFPVLLRVGEPDELEALAASLPHVELLSSQEGDPTDG